MGVPRSIEHMPSNARDNSFNGKSPALLRTSIAGVALVVPAQP